MLKIWAHNQADVTVNDLLEELKDWEEGYVATAVYKRLQNCITSDVLPTFSERAERRQRSLSSESLTSVDTDVCTNQMEASGISSSPGISGK